MHAHPTRPDRRFVLSGAAAGLFMTTLGAHPATADEDEASLERTVEALRSAMAAGDARALDGVLHEKLTYTHSDGRLQTKSDVIDELGGATTFVTLTFTQQTVSVTQDVGVVRHVYDSLRNLPDGRTSTAHIAVLQAWLRTGDGWRLLARSSTPIKA